MRLASLALCAIVATPALAQERTGALGLGLEQNGIPIVFAEQDGAYVATLAIAPFAFTFPDPVPEIVGVTFGAEGLFDLLDGPPETALFGPGSGYARHRGPDAVHFLADPLCANPAYGRGYNYLDAEARRGTSYPVAEIHVDSASRDCAAEGRWPLEADLMGLVSPLYVVVRVDGRMERLVLRFVGV